MYKNTYTISIISDTHGLLRDEVMEVLNKSDAILHAGDFADQKTYEALKDLENFHAVKGNCDFLWAKELPDNLLIELLGFKFFMCHKPQDVPKLLPEVDFVINGHTHTYKVEEKEKVTYINPGSCGNAGFKRAATMAQLLINEEDHTFEVRKIELLKGWDGSGSPKLGPATVDLDRMVSKIIKDIDAGRSTERIAKKYKVDVELVEGICRMYTTHPGVTVGGIIDKMELRKIFTK